MKQRMKSIIRYNRVIIALLLGQAIFIQISIHSTEASKYFIAPACRDESNLSHEDIVCSTDDEGRNYFLMREQKREEIKGPAPQPTVVVEIEYLKRIEKKLNALIQDQRQLKENVEVIRQQLKIQCTNANNVTEDSSVDSYKPTGLDCSDIKMLFFSCFCKWSLSCKNSV
jgi:hypothetical protein